MPEYHDSNPPEWLDRFLAALREGPTVKAAGLAAKVPLTSAYSYRKRNVHFLKAWEACLAPAGEPGVRPTGGGAKLDRFLELLAETSNISAAAGAAGVATSAIYKLRREDPEFARRWFAALAEGYDNLEMELLGRLRGGDSADAVGAGTGEGAPRPKFDTATALRCLTAHRESVAREKGRRTLAEEVTTIASINARIDEMRLKQKGTRRAIAKVRKAAAANGGRSHD